MEEEMDFENRILTPEYEREDSDIERVPAPQNPAGIHRPGKSKGKYVDLY